MFRRFTGRRAVRRARELLRFLYTATLLAANRLVWPSYLRIPCRMPTDERLLGRKVRGLLVKAWQDQTPLRGAEPDPRKQDKTAHYIDKGPGSGGRPGSCQNETPHAGSS